MTKPECETCDGTHKVEVNCSACAHRNPQYHCLRCDDSGVVEVPCECQEEREDE